MCPCRLLLKMVNRGRRYLGALGHGQITMTIHIYSHVIPELIGGAALAIDSAFAGWARRTNW